VKLALPSKEVADRSRDINGLTIIETISNSAPVGAAESLKSESSEYVESKAVFP